MLAPLLTRDSVNSRNRSDIDPIDPVNMVQMTLLWLVVASTTLESSQVSVVPPSTIKDEVLKAINTVNDLAIVLPFSTPTTIQNTAHDFANISTNGITTCCVGCVDGWHCTIETSSAHEVPDVSACFSGHYQVEGINVQALCDSLCRFTYSIMHQIARKS